MEADGFDLEKKSRNERVENHKSTSQSPQNSSAKKKPYEGKLFALPDQAGMGTQ